MSYGPRVLLATLSVRTSGKGTEYLSGWLGKARVVSFKGQPDQHGNPTWNVFVSEPEPRQDGVDPRAESGQRPARRTLPQPERMTR